MVASALIHRSLRHQHASLRYNSPVPVHDRSVPMVSRLTAAVRASRLRDAVTALYAPFCLLLICICVLWKITLTRQYTWLNTSDLVNQVWPWFQFQAVEWHHHRLALWDPFHWAGQSLIGQDQPGVAYPLNWLLFLLPLEQGRVAQVFLNWYMLTIHYMAALFAFLLCRDLGRSKTASVFGGVAFSFLGYMAAIGWPQMLNGAVWAPLALLFFLRVLRGRSVLFSGALSGTFLGISYLSGHHQIPTFLTLMLLGCWIYLFGKHPLGYVKTALSFAAFAYCLISFSALQVIPSVEYWHLALRWVGSANPLAWTDPVPYTVHAQYSMNPVSLVGLVIASLPGAANPFVGLTVLTLAAMGVVAHWKHTEMRILLTVAVCGLLYAFGAYSIFQGVLYSVIPELDKARNPATALCLAQLAAAVMAAFGLDAVTAPGIGLAPLVKKAVWALGVFAVLILSFLVVSFAVQPERTSYFAYFGTASFAAALISITLLGVCSGKFSARLAKLLLSTTLLFEVGAVAGYSYFHREQGWNLVSQLSAFDDIGAFLQSRPDLIRVRLDRDAIPFDFGDWYRIEQLDGYCGVTKNIFEVYAEDHAQMLLGETFWVGKKPSRTGQEPVFTSKSGLIVYRNPDAFPRTWSVHKIGALTDSNPIRNKLQRPLSELREEALVSGSAPALGSCEGDEVRVVSRSPSHVVLNANMKCKGMVVLNDSYFPGWKARIDGQPTPLYEVDTIIQGIVADKGTHRIEIRYVPSSVIAGAILLASGLLLLVLVGLLGRAG